MRYILETEKTSRGNEVFSKQKMQSGYIYIARDGAGKRTFVDKEWVLKNAHYISNATFNGDSFAPCEDRFDWAFEHLKKEVRESIDRAGYELSTSSEFGCLLENSKAKWRMERVAELKGHILKVSEFKKYLKSESMYCNISKFEYEDVLLYYGYQGNDLYFNVIKNIIKECIKEGHPIYVLYKYKIPKLVLFSDKAQAERMGSHVGHYSVIDCRDKKAIEAFNEMQEHIVKALRGEVEWFYNQD